MQNQPAPRAYHRRASTGVVHVTLGGRSASVGFVSSCSSDALLVKALWMALFASASGYVSAMFTPFLLLATSVALRLYAV